MSCTHRKPHSLGNLPNVIAKTWRTPYEKATGQDPEFEWLQDIADAQAPKVRRAFLRALDRVRESVDDEKLRAALAAKDLPAVMAALGLDDITGEELTAGITQPLEDVFIDAGRATPEKTLPDKLRLGMRFDIANPNTATFLRTYNFGLIRDISDTTRAGIKQVVQDAFAFGGHPYEQAKIIRESIGLTDTQAAAVDNFRSLLTNGDRQAMRRALRDRRFDSTLDRSLGQAAERQLSPDQIDRMVGRYRERMLSMRAETIARTETLRASNAGQDMAWQQAADKGLLDRATFRAQWLVVPDDRLCIYCAPIPLLNPGGVPLGGFFITPQGPVKAPPLHPNCRCIRVVEAF